MNSVGQTTLTPPGVSVETMKINGLQPATKLSQMVRIADLVATAFKGLIVGAVTVSAPAYVAALAGRGMDKVTLLDLRGFSHLFIKTIMLTAFLTTGVFMTVKSNEECLLSLAKPDRRLPESGGELVSEELAEMILEQKKLDTKQAFGMGVMIGGCFGYIASLDLAVRDFIRIA